MKRSSRATATLVAALFLFFPLESRAASHIKVVKLQVTNPTDDVRAAENIVLSVARLKQVAPDFDPANFIVVVTDAATVDEDAKVIQTKEVPSQADDIDGDHKADEIAFQISL